MAKTGHLIWQLVDMVPWQLVDNLGSCAFLVIPFKMPSAAAVINLISPGRTFVFSVISGG